MFQRVKKHIFHLFEVFKILSSVVDCKSCLKHYFWCYLSEPLCLLCFWHKKYWKYVIFCVFFAQKAENIHKKSENNTRDTYSNDSLQGEYRQICARKTCFYNVILLVVEVSLKQKHMVCANFTVFCEFSDRLLVEIVYFLYIFHVFYDFYVYFYL